MELAREELGIQVVERRIDRSELYLADEIFLSGTAAHLTPVISLDSRDIADGKPGPVSTQLKQMYFDIVFGRNPKYLHCAPPPCPKWSRPRRRRRVPWSCVPVTPGRCLVAGEMKGNDAALPPDGAGLKPAPAA